MAIPLTVGSTRENMIAALNDWVVTTCGLDLNHHAVGHPAKATILDYLDALEDHGVSAPRSFPTLLAYTTVA